MLPVVLHFGRRRWRTTTDLQTLVDLDSVPQALRAAVASCLPQFAFAVHDFAGRSADEVRGMALSLHGLCTVSLLQFLAPYGGDDERVAAFLAEWKDVARSIAESPPDRTRGER